MPKNTINKTGALLFLLTITAVVAIIVFLKNGSGDEMPVSADSLSSDSRAIARPDTTIASEISDIISTPDTIAAAPPDSIGRDKRPAGEAGAEDGYWDGYYDGVAAKSPNPDNVSSNFPTIGERAVYAKNYAENYDRGYAEGRHGKPLQSAGE
ncbi:hypothetical protein [Prevotella sp. MGM2]|uniref:hypothetical protein n=1 Tax=Prevotella sp. MGM2 TaxID=2033406 RepID=UPI000CEA2F52|nr:hypothetical protein [Prevotella sp. MGM2]GAY29549.1 hypothetical protein PvtlMGM2_0402 [Prevotella sp. MGM2]